MHFIVVLTRVSVFVLPHSFVFHMFTLVVVFVLVSVYASGLVESCSLLIRTIVHVFVSPDNI